MTEHAVSAIGAGVFVGILGVLIRYAGVTELIAGYDPRRVSDAEGLADFVGANALYVAALSVGVGVLELRAGAGWHWIAFVIAVLAVTVRTIRGARRYESAPEGNAPDER